MFEKELEEKFKRIFKVNKVSFDQPAKPAEEQKVLFVQVDEAKNTVRDGVFESMISGQAVMYAPNSELPFGFFSKAIAQSNRDDTKDLFFSDFEANTRRYRNIVQRGFNFIYFFRGQYDPKMGTIESVDFIEG